MKDDILREIRKNKYITAAEISVLLNKSARTIKRYIGQLVKDGELKRSASRKAGYWEIIN